MTKGSSTGRLLFALAVFRARLAFRRGGGFLGILTLAAAGWAAHELGGRVAGADWAHDKAEAWDALARSVAFSAVAIFAVAWPLARARARSRDDSDGILDVQPLAGGTLAAMHGLEITLMLAALATLVAIGMSPLASGLGVGHVALVPLGVAPLAGGLAYAGALRPWPMLIPMAAAAGLLGWAAVQSQHVPPVLSAWPAVPVLAGAGIVVLGLGVGFAAPRIRASRARGRSPRHARRGFAVGATALRRALGFLPRPMSALLAADVAFVARGTHLRGKVAVPLLWCVPLVYLAWPIPPQVAGAPLLVAGMLSAFGLAGLGFVLGADLAVAERPYLALRRTSPVDARAVWWSRLLLAAGAGCVFAAVLSVAIIARHGQAGLELLAPIAILGILVPAHAAAIGLAADAANDTATASAIAMSAACVAALVLVAWVAFPPLIALYPLMMRGTYARARKRWRRIEVV